MSDNSLSGVVGVAALGAAALAAFFLLKGSADSADAASAPASVVSSVPAGFSITLPEGYGGGGVASAVQPAVTEQRIIHEYIPASGYSSVPSSGGSVSPSWSGGSSGGGVAKSLTTFAGASIDEDTGVITLENGQRLYPASMSFEDMGALEAYYNPNASWYEKQGAGLEQYSDKGLTLGDVKLRIAQDNYEKYGDPNYKPAGVVSAVSGEDSGSGSGSSKGSGILDTVSDFGKMVSSYTGYGAVKEFVTGTPEETVNKSVGDSLAANVSAGLVSLVAGAGSGSGSSGSGGVVETVQKFVSGGVSAVQSAASSAASAVSSWASGVVSAVSGVFGGGSSSGSSSSSSSGSGSSGSTSEKHVRPH